MSATELDECAKADKNVGAPEKTKMRTRRKQGEFRACNQPPLDYFPCTTHPGNGCDESGKRLYSMASANDIRKGIAIEYNGDIAVVLECQHRTPGNLRAFVQATIRSLKTGKSSDVRFSSTEKIETVPLKTCRMEFSYKDGDDYVFSDPETFETVTLTSELLGDAKNYIVENSLVTVTFVAEKAIGLEVPPSVVLTVTDAPEGIRGDSASNVQKSVTLETGITVQVPLFIKTGEKIRIDSRTNKYMERA